MIQVFKLICFGENKVENVQKTAVPTGALAAGDEPNLCRLQLHSLQLQHPLQLQLQLQPLETTALEMAILPVCWLPWGCS